MVVCKGHPLLAWPPEYVDVSTTIPPYMWSPKRRRYRRLSYSSFVAN